MGNTVSTKDEERVRRKSAPAYYGRPRSRSSVSLGSFRESRKTSQNLESTIRNRKTSSNLSSTSDMSSHPDAQQSRFTDRNSSDLLSTSEPKARKKSRGSSSASEKSPPLNNAGGKERRKTRSYSTGSHISEPRKMQKCHSVEGTSSEPKLRRQKYSFDEDERLVESNTPLSGTSKSFLTLSDAEKTMVKFMEAHLKQPMYVKLIPTFDVQQEKHLRTSYVVTFWLKRMRSAKRRPSTEDLIYEADILFSEAKTICQSDDSSEFFIKNNGKLIRAHTWSGKASDIQFAENTLRIHGNFTNPDMGTLEHLKFELILQNATSKIDHMLLTLGNMASLTHFGVDTNAVISGERQKKMTGWFSFQDTRNKSQKTLIWKAHIDDDVNFPDKLHETLHVSEKM